jgi:predicted RNase H-like HicB family nuclease/predicted RNA binding protein YcfA (HicA-like mRNA interferase family)
LKVGDVVRLLEQDGWRLARTRGSHRQFKHPSKAATVTVAGKPGVDVPPGTLKRHPEAGRPEKVRHTVMRYMVVIERGENSWGAHVPDLPGCVAVGDTREEVVQLIREAIDFHIGGLRQDGLPVPSPASESEFVDVSAA